MALTTKQNKEKIIAHLQVRYHECINEKHSNLLRIDILHSLWMIRNNAREDELESLIQKLIGEKESEKHRKSYQKILK
ncbi:hypothetical protein ACFLXB_09520 [Chloroflexota bacterium]